MFPKYERDDVRMMLPPPLARISTAAARAVKNVPVRLTRKTSSHASSSSFDAIPSRVIPAKCASTSTRPYSSFVRANRSATLAWSATSTPRARTVSPKIVRTRSRSRSAATTRAPSSENRNAVARPIPLAAPVTIATFPSRRFTPLRFVHLRGGRLLRQHIRGGGARSAGKSAVPRFARKRKSNALEFWDVGRSDDHRRWNGGARRAKSIWLVRGLRPCENRRIHAHARLRRCRANGSRSRVQRVDLGRFDCERILGHGRSLDHDREHARRDVDRA